ARAYSVASRVIAGKDVLKAKRFADRAAALLEETIAGGYLDYPNLQTDADLDPLRDRAGHLLERSYAAVWHPVAGWTSIEVYGHDPIEHLTRSTALVADGARPVSSSTAEIGHETPLATASVG